MSKMLEGWKGKGDTWRLAWRTHRERRCVEEDPPVAALLPVFPSSTSPPSSPSSSSPSTVTLMLISGLLGGNWANIKRSQGNSTHLGRVVTLRFSVLDWEWSLKETLRTLTGLGGTIRNGIPEWVIFLSALFSDFYLSFVFFIWYLPAKVLLESIPSRSSAEKLRRLWVGDMLGVGWITLISIWRLVSVGCPPGKGIKLRSVLRPFLSPPPPPPPPPPRPPRPPPPPPRPSPFFPPGLESPFKLLDSGGPRSWGRHL